ncbi:amino acid aminotransferase [Mycobacterium sp.]|uniref:amino acid aminotransferase n=1 Tax=Mycobacterium sp. TaxID=1785 RepID=UPI002C4C211A|nr:amino acid aminotransferase [Mycobacterium sp.]HME49687.1 amino acid aminotransferase [Mycobacterium sp.]
MTTTTAYDVPDYPADPEAAALEMIVRLPERIMHTNMFTEPLQAYCGALHFEGAFAGLCWADAKQVAAAVSFDITQRDDAADFLRNRARDALAGTDNMAWDDQDGVVRALTIAASVFGL